MKKTYPILDKMRKVSKTLKARPTSMKGGFYNSDKVWSFKICKLLIKALGEKPPAGTGTNWNECIRYLASVARVSPEELYNKITPDDFLKKIGRGHLLRARGGAWGMYDAPWEEFSVLWSRAKGDTTIRPLPGKPMSEARRESAEAWEERGRKEEWLATEENNYLRKMDPEAYNRRLKELEEGDSICCSEECEDRFNEGADVGWCRAYRKGRAKRNARHAAEREAALKAKAQKAANAAVAANAAAAAAAPASSVAIGNLLNLNGKRNNANANKTRRLKDREEELAGLF